MQRLEIGRRTFEQIVRKDTWALLKRGIHRNKRFSYYESLGITPNATQADVKTAFYKLSKEFHPDKQTGNEAKFKEISTAYEVLGNLKLRRLYDRGQLPAGVTDARNMDVDDPDEIYPRKTQQPNYSEQFDRKKPPPSGKTDKYDFDAWTRAHYSDHFRPESRRNQYVYMRFQRQARAEQLAMERVVFVFACFVLSLAFYSSTVNHWDRPRSKPVTVTQTLEDTD